jgi:hypothetical protein
MNMLPLVNYNSAYYKYPTSICRGYWGRYALDIDLSDEARQRRNSWLNNTERLSHTPFNKHIFSRYNADDDYMLLVDILRRHGIFAEKFFHRALRHRVLGEMAADPNEQKMLKVLLEEAWGYKTAFGRKATEDVFFVIDHIFEQHLVRAVNDSFAYNGLLEWYKKYIIPRVCTVCGASYRIIDLPDWVYVGSNGTHVCCMRCRIVARPSKKALLSHLHEFVRACGFIPSADATPLNYLFTSRLLAAQWPAVFAAYGKMGGIDHVKAKYTSWFKALSLSGALPDGVMATSRGIRCLAKDGHVCLSLDEQQIDDWLTAHNLSHVREPEYPVHPLLNPHGKRRSDWLVGNIYIEYFGLTGEKGYDKKKDEKILLAKQLGLTMVALYPSDILILDNKLTSLLKFM